MAVERESQERSRFEAVKDDIGQLSEYLGPKETEKQLRGMYLINTRLWLDDLSKKYQTSISIGNVPDEEWNKLFDKYDNFWFMGIYKPSQKGQESAKNYWEQYQNYLPDIDKEKDVVSSPFAIPEYFPGPRVAEDWPKWDGMVKELHKLGKKVFIDFVPNHTALDHPWVQSHPEYYIQGNKQQYNKYPGQFVEIIDNQGQVRYFAHGKDLSFPPNPWTDTLQLNYANLDLQEKMAQELENLAKHTDGFRCDMAMLIDPDTFITSWNWCLNLSEEEKEYLRKNPFWQKTIPEIKKKVALEDNKNIEFIAEAYWDEKELGEYFDFIYDKSLYDKIVDGIRTGYIFGIKDRLKSLIGQSDEIKNRWVIFTENHDEDRVVEKMGEKFSKPAAVLSAMVRGSIFMVNQGQESGCRYRPPMQVSRYRNEENNLDMAKFYDDLMAIRRSNLFQTGEIKIINSENGDQNSILFEITKADTNTRAIVAVNISKVVSTAEIKKTEDHLTIYNLTSGEKSKDDEITNEKLTLKLEPGEVKIACLSSVECVLSEIKPRSCF